MVEIKKLFCITQLFFVVPLFSVAQNKFVTSTKNKFVVIATRGNHTNAPENTLAAYQNAINDSADFVSADLRTTMDGRLVIMHNLNIFDMTGYDGEVKNMLFDSLLTKKIRDTFNPQWGLYIIPTLQQVLQLCKGKINVYINVEDADAGETFTEILNASMENNVVVYVDEPNQLQTWQTLAPMIPLVISLPGAITAKQQFNQLLDELNIDILDGNFTGYNVELVQAAKEKQVPVWADIQIATEGPDSWKAALELGLTGLQTNNPKELIIFLIKKNAR